MRGLRWNAWIAFLAIGHLSATILFVGRCGGGGSYSASVSYTVGGTVSGLAGSVLVLQNNDGNNLSVSNGLFTFTNALGSRTAHSVMVLTQPTNPSQTCGRAIVSALKET